MIGKNDFNAVSEIFEVKSFYEELETMSHEVVLGIVSTFDQYGKLIDIDTKYWRHYEYTEETGFQRVASGDHSDTMNPYVYEIFRNFKEKLEEKFKCA